MRVVVALALIGCSDPGAVGPEFDGATGAEPISSLSAVISWTPADSDDVRYAIYAADAPGGQDFASPATVTERGAVRGALSGLEPGKTSYVVVRAVDDQGVQDDNTVEITATAGGPVSLSATVEVIYERRCSYPGCHAAAEPAGELDLSPGASFAATVGVEAAQCAAPRLLVAAGEPGASYLIDKIVDRDICAGVRMPMTGNVSSVDVQIISDWITEGALDN